jgi:hypothetical protein
LVLSLHLPPLPRWAATLQFVIPNEAEGSAVLSPAKQLRRVKALKAAELLEGEAHRRSLGFLRISCQA